MYDVPDAFRGGPFARAHALEAGIPRRVLHGVQFVRDHQGVYHHRDHQMTFCDRITAARLALPTAARTTGITRLQELGLSHGPSSPLHFVVQGDHHLALDGVFLHRTALMPPHDAVGVMAEAAFVAYCAEARTIDAVKVGSILLHRDLLDVEALGTLLAAQPWRRGVVEARWVLPHLDARCRSLPEAELLTLVRFAGLPEPDVNVTIELEPGVTLTPDLWFDAHRRAVEYEGSHHQEERGQYNADIDRYVLYRRHDVGYAQITKERLRTPKAAVRQVYSVLADGGYEGLPPVFGQLWSLLFTRLADVVRPRHGPRRPCGD